jgi:hypothetical protein
MGSIGDFSSVTLGMGSLPAFGKIDGMSLYLLLPSPDLPPLL